MTEEEARIAVLEAQRESHEERHTRETADLKESFERIDKQFEKVDTRFDTLETLIRNNNGQRGSLKRLAPPIASGGGFVAIIYFLIDRLVQGG